MTLEDLVELPLVADAAARVRDRYGPLEKLDSVEQRRAVLHELVDFQVAELVAQSRGRLEALGIDSVAEVQEAFRGADGRRGVRIVEHAPAVSAGKKQLEKFLFQRVYRSDRVMAVREAAQEKLTRLFRWYCDHPAELPSGFQTRAGQFGVPRSVADYIAGMTDRFAMREHERLTGRKLL